MFIYFVLIAEVLIIGLILYFILKSPFQYPYFKYSFDVSGKRKPEVENLIDIFLNEKNFSKIEKHKEKIEKWKNDCQRMIEKSILKKYRYKQYQKSLNDNRAYNFYLTRTQTRYRQRNYIRTPYKVRQIVNLFSCDYKFL